MKFDQPLDLGSIIKVIGVGGGGSNAVNHMFAQGIKGVDFLVCNTDRQALDISPVPARLQLGAGLTEGLGAGSIPERGKHAAHENIEQIRQLLSQRTKMVFITAGMGGGTGTGAAPVIAQIAREMGILTVGIVTLPFNWEGKKRRLQATGGIEELRAAVDTLLIINNDRLRDLYGNLSLDNAFEHADNVLTTAARGIAEVITVTGKVNVDFEDVKTVMSNSGVAIMGMSEAEGEDRALRAAQEALNSPLLNDNDIRGAKYVLLNITHGEREVLMDEITEITDHIQDAAGSTADVIWGYCKDESLGDRLRVTLIATGFDRNPEIGGLTVQQPERKVIPLDAPMPVTRPIGNPVTGQPAVPKPATAAPVKPNEPYIKVVEPTPAPAPAPPVKPAAVTPPQVIASGPPPPVVSTPSPAPVIVPAPVVSTPPPPVVVSAPPPAVASEPPPPVVSTPAPAPVAEATSQEPEPEPVIEVTPVAQEKPAMPELKEEAKTEVPEVKADVPPTRPVATEPVKPAMQDGRPVPPWLQNTPKPAAEPAKPATPVTTREFEFDVRNEVKPATPAPPPPPVEEKKVFQLDGGATPDAGTPSTARPLNSRGVEDRLARMRELSLKLRTPNGLVDLEKEPAYIRKKVSLTEGPTSSDSNISRYSLTEGTDENGEKRVELKKNNPYLHDNVD